MVVNPGWKTPADNSSGGSAVGGGGELELPSSRFTGASDGAGFRLGSQGGSCGGSNLSAREAARQRWASVNSSGSSAKTVTASTAKTITASGAKTTTANGRSASHSNITIASVGDQNKLDGSKMSKKPSDVNTSPVHVPCPICQKKLPEADINQHLDSCLASEDSQEDPFENDEDDADLLAATVDLENSIHAESDDEPLVQTKIIISDSDDDEPLIKRPNKRKRHEDSKSDNQNDVFGDITAQDDQDILAALEDSTDQNADQSMFACPICDKLLSHNIMFKHLDTCLATM
eukprot:GFUD01037628.1.p1 GENE.GFUD01037628.1~~GFUD01037628.1.p1  ORF type:complete len:305 (+),score=103.54 GFUD01037628.1:46-915(+)